MGKFRVSQIAMGQQAGQTSPLAVTRMVSLKIPDVLG